MGMTVISHDTEGYESPLTTQSSSTSGMLSASVASASVVPKDEEWTTIEKAAKKKQRRNNRRRQRRQKKYKLAPGKPKANPEALSRFGRKSSVCSVTRKTTRTVKKVVWGKGGTYVHKKNDWGSECAQAVRKPESSRFGDAFERSRTRRLSKLIKKTRSRIGINVPTKCSRFQLS